jgi:hypothetical protein
MIRHAREGEPHGVSTITGIDLPPEDEAATAPTNAASASAPPNAE